MRQLALLRFLPVCSLPLLVFACGDEGAPSAGGDSESEMGSGGGGARPRTEDKNAGVAGFGGETGTGGGSLGGASAGGAAASCSVGETSPCALEVPSLPIGDATCVGGAWDTSSCRLCVSGGAVACAVAKPTHPIGNVTCSADGLSYNDADTLCADGSSPTYGASGQSCDGMAGDECQGESCCLSIVLPSGDFMMGRGTVVTDADYYVRGYSQETPEHPVSVSSFALDKYGITVGRFRAFAEQYDGTGPLPGAGAHPSIPGTGWDSAWDANLPADRATLLSRLKCSGVHHTWTDAPGENENRALDCINWFEAAAFCAWDGGRLPTEAEREYAAAGGDENRLYPWGEAVPDSTLANYGNNLGSIDLVGNYPAGNGRWGHADLAGNLMEWAMDRYSANYYSLPEASGSDIGNIPLGSSNRALRGGSFHAAPEGFRAAYRLYSNPTYHTYTIGARCARND